MATIICSACKKVSDNGGKTLCRQCEVDEISSFIFKIVRTVNGVTVCSDFARRSRFHGPCNWCWATKNGNILYFNAKKFECFQHIAQSAIPVQVFLMGRVTNAGYVAFSCAGRNMLAHRYVYEAWNDVRVTRALVTAHINDCKTDNRPENLKLCTQSENIRDSFHTGRSHAVFRNARPVDLIVEKGNGEKLTIHFKSAYAAETALSVKRASILKVIGGFSHSCTGFQDGCTVRIIAA